MVQTRKELITEIKVKDLLDFDCNLTVVDDVIQARYKVDGRDAGVGIIVDDLELEFAKGSMSEYIAGLITDGRNELIKSL